MKISHLSGQRKEASSLHPSPSSDPSSPLPAQPPSDVGAVSLTAAPLFLPCLSGAHPLQGPETPSRTHRGAAGSSLCPGPSLAARSCSLGCLFHPCDLLARTRPHEYLQRGPQSRPLDPRTPGGDHGITRVPLRPSWPYTRFVTPRQTLPPISWGSGAPRRATRTKTRGRAASADWPRRLHALTGRPWPRVTPSGPQSPHPFSEDKSRLCVGGSQ